MRVGFCQGLACVANEGSAIMRVLTVAGRALLVMVCGLSAAICLFILLWFVLPSRYFIKEDIEPIKTQIENALSVKSDELKFLGGEFCRESTVLFEIDACGMSFDGLSPITGAERFRDECTHVAAVLKMFQPDRTEPVIDKIYEIRLEVDTILVASANGTAYVMFLGMQ